MDEHLDAVVAGQAHGVQGGSHLVHGAVKGGIDGLAGGLDAAAGAQDALCKGLVGDVGLRQHLAADGGQHGLALAEELCGLLLLCLAAEQLVKKSHIKIPSFRSLHPGAAGAGQPRRACRARFAIRSIQKIPYCAEKFNCYPA